MQECGFSCSCGYEPQSAFVANMLFAVAIFKMYLGLLMCMKAWGSEVCIICHAFLGKVWCMDILFDIGISWCISMGGLFFIISWCTSMLR